MIPTTTTMTFLETTTNEISTTTLESFTTTEITTTTDDPTTTTMESIWENVPSWRIHIPSHTCHINHRNVCFFNNLHLNDTHPYFNPSSNNIPSMNVTNVDLGGNYFDWSSIIHTLTSDVCDEFQNIHIYRAVYLDLVKIHANAFENCTKAEVINLSWNQLRWLDPSLFEHNFHLKRLELENNLLGMVDPQLFQHLEMVTLMTLNGNRLKYFPIKQMRVFPNLRMLDISGNHELPDFDIHKVIKKFPKLMKILLCDSKNITAVRMQGIFKALNNRNIKTREAGRCNNFYSNKVELPETRALLPVHTPDVDIETGLPIYKCYMTINYYGEDTCLFSGLDLDEEHALFVPVPVNISNDNVTKVFMKGKIHTLTSDICDTFWNIVTFYAFNLEAVAIQPNAFHACHKLEKLDLKNNHVVELDDTLFKYNKKLKSLNVEGLQLTRLDTKLLTFVPQLEILNLSDNDLTEFPVRAMPPLKNLRLLSIEYNRFRELDQQEIINHFPGLKMITLCKHAVNKDVLFNSTKINELRVFFKQRNVHLECVPLMPIENVYQFV